jgi:hypothetical protein
MAKSVRTGVSRTLAAASRITSGAAARRRR